jgi:hypothetical protein
MQARQEANKTVASNSENFKATLRSRECLTARRARGTRHYPPRTGEVNNILSDLNLFGVPGRSHFTLSWLPKLQIPILKLVREIDARTVALITSIAHLLGLEIRIRARLQACRVDDQKGNGFSLCSYGKSKATRIPLSSSPARAPSSSLPRSAESGIFFSQIAQQNYS